MVPVWLVFPPGAGMGLLSPQAGEDSAGVQGRLRCSPVCTSRLSS